MSKRSLTAERLSAAPTLAIARRVSPSRSARDSRSDWMSREYDQSAKAPAGMRKNMNSVTVRRPQFSHTVNNHKVTWGSSMSDVVTSLASHKAADTSRDNALSRRVITVALLVAVGYYLTAKIGFAFALQPGSVSTLWMPNSILLAGLLLVPKRSWWIVLVAVFPAHLASEVQSGVPAAMILSWFLSNSFQALFGAFFICKFVNDGLRFDKFRDLTIFLVFGAFLSPFLSSFLDVALVKLNGWGTNSYWEIWRVRCLSNILATLTLVPVIITWVRGGFAAARSSSWRRYLEAGILTAGLFAVGLTVFSSHYWLAEKTPSLLYWPLPFLLWAAVRFGPQGVSTALLVVMFLAINGATHGEGPFVANSSAQRSVDPMVSGRRFHSTHGIGRRN